MNQRALAFSFAFTFALAACSDDATSSDSMAESAESADTGESGETGETGEAPEPADYGPARGDLLITGIEVSQSIAQPVYAAGVNVPGDDYIVPLLKNRYTIVRALWDTPEGWTPRPLIARLHVEHPDGTTAVFDDFLASHGTPMEVDSESTPSNLFSGFFWRLDPEYVVPGMTYQVSIWEAAPADDVAESSAGNLYPDSGPAPLTIQPDDSEIRIALVGVRYNYGGCVTDTSALPDDEFEALRAGFEAWNGVETNKVILDTGLAVDIDYAVNGVPSLLGIVGQLRAQYAESIPDAFFYILWDDCSPLPQGVLGIALINNDPPVISDAATRYGAGLWNPNDVRESVNTAVHEVGHNQGAPHAPCGVGDSYDPFYPHAGASIGVRGLDPLDGAMYSPNQHTDFMSYCRPYWVSDYRWIKSFNHQRIMTSWSMGNAVADAPVQIEGYAGAVLIGLITPDAEPQWWINSRKTAPEVSLDGELEVALELGGAVVPVASRVKQIPDLPGARLVEVPLVTGVDVDAITSIRVHGSGVAAVQASPAIVDYRGLKVSGSPSKLLAP